MEGVRGSNPLPPTTPVTLVTGGSSGAVEQRISKGETAVSCSTVPLFIFSSFAFHCALGTVNCSLLLGGVVV